jgi:hypothetical protein
VLTPENRHEVLPRLPLPAWTPRFRRLNHLPPRRLTCADRVRQ